MSSFTELGEERAEEIRKLLQASRSADQGVSFSDTGEVLGTAPVSSSPDDARNVIGKYDTHYVK